jgi:hypothetical protein
VLLNDKKKDLYRRLIQIQQMETKVEDEKLLEASVELAENATKLCRV